jgi:hypothetical protein
MGLRELAREASVPPSYLAELEQGKEEESVAGRVEETCGGSRVPVADLLE